MAPQVEKVPLLVLLALSNNERVMPVRARMIKLTETRLLSSFVRSTSEVGNFSVDGSETAYLRVHATEKGWDDQREMVGRYA